MNCENHLGMDLMKLFSFGETEYGGWKGSFIQLNISFPSWDHVDSLSRNAWRTPQMKTVPINMVIKVINSVSLCLRNSSSNIYIKADEKRNSNMSRGYFCSNNITV